MKSNAEFFLLEYMKFQSLSADSQQWQQQQRQRQRYQDQQQEQRHKEFCERLGASMWEVYTEAQKVETRRAQMPEERSK